MKKWQVFSIIMAISVLLAGCGNMIPNLSDEENEMITEYAASILLKYDSNYSSRLVDTSIIPDDLLKKEEPIPVENETEEVSQEMEQETSETNDISESAMDEPASIGDFFGLQGVKVDYSGYQIASSYSSGDEGEWMPSIDATDGKNLFILQLTIENISTEDIEVDMLSQNARFLITLNERTSQTALTTMLLNDFATFDEVIKVGEKEDTVLIIEIPENLEGISSISLYMKNQTEAKTINL